MILLLLVAAMALVLLVAMMVLVLVVIVWRAAEHGENDYQPPFKQGEAADAWTIGRRNWDDDTTHKPRSS
jgi:hypothetical protein